MNKCILGTVQTNLQQSQWLWGASQEGSHMDVWLSEHLSGWTDAANPQLCQHRLHVAPESWTFLQGLWGVRGCVSARQRHSGLSVKGWGNQSSVLWVQQGSATLCSILMEQGSFPGHHSALLFVLSKSVVSGVTVGRSTLFLPLPPFDCLVCLGWK